MLRGDIAVSHWPLPFQAPCVRQMEFACTQGSISRVFSLPRTNWTSSCIMDVAGVRPDREPIPLARTHLSAPKIPVDFVQCCIGRRRIRSGTPLDTSVRLVASNALMRQSTCDLGRACACVIGPIHLRRPATNRTDEPEPFRVQWDRQKERDPVEKRPMERKELCGSTGTCDDFVGWVLQSTPPNVSWMEWETGWTQHTPNISENT